MSFTVILENPPEGAAFWKPIIYYRDPTTGSYDPYTPDGYLEIYELDAQPWICPLSAGSGIMVDFRCVVFDINYKIIGKRDLKNVIISDGEMFTYDWAETTTAGLNVWWLAIPAIALAAVSIFKRKK